MNLLDALVVISVVSAAVGGWRLGLLARSASWLGLTIGFFAAVRLLPRAVELGSQPSSRLVIAVVVLLVGALGGQGLGLVIGSHLRAVVAPGPLKAVDHGAGGVVGAVGILVALWLLLPSIAVVPGWPARQARGSAIARGIDSLAPKPPDTVQTVRRLVGDDAFPRVFEALRPAPDPGPPPTTLRLEDGVEARVAASSVKIEGEACRRLQQGSGFAVAGRGADVVVTNAHVVAGEARTEVIRDDGRRLPARVVVFDADRDLAVLVVPGLGRPALSVADTKVGAMGAVAGHPDGQDALRIAPAAVRQRVDAVGRDLYDRRQTRRQVYVLAANLHQGDSGGALVDIRGDVVGVAFAIAPDRPGTSYALTSTELRAVLAAPARRADTGPCLRG